MSDISYDYRCSDGNPAEGGTMSKISRRAFATLAAGAPFALRAQPKALRRAVKIDTERVIGEIDPMITETSSSTWDAASTAACSKRARRSPIPTGFARTCWTPSRNSTSRCCAGRAAISRPTTTGGRHRSARPASAAAGNGLGHRRDQPLRHPRVPELRGNARNASRTSARTSAPAPGPRRSSGWSTAIPSEDTAMTRLRKQNGRAAPWKVTTGASATRWTVPGRWAIAAPRTMASSRWKPPS